MTSKRTIDQICNSCNAQLTLSADSSKLTCDYCGTEESITHDTRVNEKSYSKDMRRGRIQPIDDSLTMLFITCPGCHAEISVDKSVHADTCPYCGMTYVTTEKESEVGLVPDSILPFQIEEDEAIKRYKKWVRWRFLTTYRFVKESKSRDSVKGVYIPHWIYDTNVSTNYTGRKGVDYYVTETYYAKNSEGKMERKTRRVKRTRWYSVSGKVKHRFDDLMYPASDSLPVKYMEALEPWDLSLLVRFDPIFLTGYRAERYSITLEEGFANVEDEMVPTIKKSIYKDIGGDHQSISTMDHNYHNTQYNHTLLPVWLATYRHKNKIYRTMVNACTGEVRGERPWSWIKILLFLLVVTALVWWLSVEYIIPYLETVSY